MVNPKILIAEDNFKKAQAESKKAMERLADDLNRRQGEKMLEMLYNCSAGRIYGQRS